VAVLRVELVAPDRKVWSGEAVMVIAKTSEGDVGVLPGHAPLLANLANGPVEIRPESGETVLAAVFGGFLSVAQDSVSILAESAELSSEIDRAAAEAELREAEGDTDAADRAARARARLRVAERAG
jgi:F-type H+-transporting ATPase subunit epsilon